MLSESIRITNEPSRELSEFLKHRHYSQVVIVTDEHTHSLCYPKIQHNLPTHAVIEIRSGEEHKNIETCLYIWQSLTNLKADRHACVVVLGGGVLGDMVGFCAATYKRGIHFVLIPTTLLAQADASIGGKLGIDFNHYKNHIGVFQQPVFTILFSGFLNTLPEKELRSGFAEVIKHTLISDENMWDHIRRKSIHDQSWEVLLKHSAVFKHTIIQQDPTEKGIRKILNAGHTIGHALESYFLEKTNKITHGEAVAAGLLAEAFIAEQKQFIDKKYLDEIKNYIFSIYGKLSFQHDQINSIAKIVLQDKKNKDNEIRCVLLKGKGNAVWDCVVSLKEIEQSLVSYLSA